MKNFNVLMIKEFTHEIVLAITLILNDESHFVMSYIYIALARRLYNYNFP